MSDPVADRLNDLRSRVLAGEKISTEEYRLVIESLRSKRTGDLEKASEKPTARGVAKQAKTAKETKSLAELLAGVKKGA
jgi:hypothetical protein